MSDEPTGPIVPRQNSIANRRARDVTGNKDDLAWDGLTGKPSLVALTKKVLQNQGDGYALFSPRYHMVKQCYVGSQILLSLQLLENDGTIIAGAAITSGSLKVKRIRANVETQIEVFTWDIDADGLCSHLIDVAAESWAEEDIIRITQTTVSTVSIDGDTYDIPFIPQTSIILEDYEDVVTQIEDIKLKTDALPTDPADESALEAAITSAVNDIRGEDDDTLKVISDELNIVSFGDGVVVDIDGGSATPAPDLGTWANPTNDMDLAYTIATAMNLKVIYINGYATLTAHDWSGFKFIGMGVNVSGVDINNQTTSYSMFHKLDVTGITKSFIEVYDGYLSDVYPAHGIIAYNSIIEYIEFGADNKTVWAFNCKYAFNAEVNFNGKTNCGLQSFNANGALYLSNMTKGPARATLYCNTLLIIIDNTDTAGQLWLYGEYVLNNNASTSTIVPHPSEDIKDIEGTGFVKDTDSLVNLAHTGADGDTLEILSDEIDAVLAAFPADPAIETTVESAITASEGVVTGAISSSEGVITGAITSSEGNIRGEDSDDLTILSDQLDGIATSTDDIANLPHLTGPGVCQMYVRLLDLVSEDDDYIVGEAFGSDLLIESLVFKMPESPDITDDIGDFTGISIQSDEATPYVFISQANGVKANLTEGKNITWTGAVILPAVGSIYLTIYGGPADASTMSKTIIKYRAVETGDMELPT